MCVLRLRGRRGILRNEGGLEGWWSGCDGDWVAASSCRNGGGGAAGGAGVPQAVPIGCGGGGDKARDSQDRTRPEIRTWAVASHGGRSLYMLGRVSGCREEYRAVPEGSGPETGQRDAARSSLSGRSITNKGASLQFRYM